MLTSTTRRVPNVFVWILRREAWLRRQIQGRVLCAAQQRALHRFTEQYPQWADSLFDAFFLSHGAAPLLAGYLTDHRPTASALAAAWAAQCPSPPSSLQPLDLAEAMRVAAAFLHILEAELELYTALLV